MQKSRAIKLFLFFSAMSLTLPLHAAQNAIEYQINVPVLLENLNNIDFAGLSTTKIWFTRRIVLVKCAAVNKNEIDIKNNGLTFSPKAERRSRPTSIKGRGNEFFVIDIKGKNSMRAAATVYLTIPYTQRKKYTHYACFFGDGKRISNSDLLKSGIDAGQSKLLSWGKLK